MAIKGIANKCFFDYKCNTEYTRKVCFPIDHKRYDYSLEDYITNHIARTFTLPLYRFFKKRKNLKRAKKTADIGFKLGHIIPLSMITAPIHFTYDLLKYGYAKH